MNKYQTQKLENYKEKEIMSIFNAPIVVEVREFKDKIEDANRRLKDLEELMRDLNNKLIL